MTTNVKMACHVIFDNLDFRGVWNYVLATQICVCVLNAIKKNPQIIVSLSFINNC